MYKFFIPWIPMAFLYGFPWTSPHRQVFPRNSVHSAGLARAWVLAGAAASLPQLWCLVSHGWGQGMGGGDQEITDITDVYKCVYI